MSWNKLSKSKKDGGIGFKDLDLFNVALLSKQAWCVVVNQEALYNPWISSLPNFKIISQRHEDSPIIYVSDLIDSRTHSWIKPLLLANFSTSEYHAIMKIPLGKEHQQDKWIWHFNASGILTVRSAYHLLKQKQDREQLINTPSSSFSQRSSFI
uniref:Reverse transcriptase zinc-binding domain-containing protein n=1 Tax=Manihot esculenta TaxID=3983 RepID=A0A2C9V002_MANES